MDHTSKSQPEPAQKAIGDNVRAFLEHLTGPSRGHTMWLSKNRLCVGVGADRLLQTEPDDCISDGTGAQARLVWSGETYEIEALGDADLWVNGRKTGAAHLMHGDMIEFGESGPMSRFRLCEGTFPTRWPVEEIVGDAVAYARTSRRPFGSRLSNVLFDTVRRILLETTLVFRATVVIVLVALTTFVIWQYRSDIMMESRLREEALRIEAITTALAETQQNALSDTDLALLREQFNLRLTTNAERLSTLEQRLEASARVIGQSTPSVAFLQGAYGLRQKGSGKLLRHVLGDDGTPLQTPFGKPLVDPDGTGEPVEIQFTGTGFLLKDTGFLVTNRHVALPWTSGDRMQAFEQSGLEPEMLKLLVYLPEMQQPIGAELQAVSHIADVAILSVPPTATVGLGLTLAQNSPNIGDEVILIGFATGLRALLAQAGRAFLEDLETTGEVGFWSIAARLSLEGKIAPLASRGIIAQVAARAVVYDAETTVGGSGGPALNSDGEVVAVNAAILPEFGGANIGVPVREIRRLLEAATD